MKKTTRIVLIIMIVFFITIPCFGAGRIDIDTFEPTYNTNMGTAKTLGGKILGYIINIAAVSSVVIIAFMGLKFMVGSVEQKAEYKKHYIPLIIGMFLVLGSSTILNIFWSTTSGEHEHTYNGQLTCVSGAECTICGEFSPPDSSRHGEIEYIERI